MIMEHSAGAVVYRKRADRQLEYLIVQSVVNYNWGFPKGHLEGSEDAQEAARREVHEEVGLQPKFDLNFVRKTQYALTDTRSKTVTFFLAEYVPGQEVVTQKEEIKDSRWVTLDEARKYLTEHGKMQVLKAAQEYIQKK